MQFIKSISIVGYYFPLRKPFDIFKKIQCHDFIKHLQVQPFYFSILFINDIIVFINYIIFYFILYFFVLILQI